MEPACEDKSFFTEYLLLYELYHSTENVWAVHHPPQLLILSNQLIDLNAVQEAFARQNPLKSQLENQKQLILK